MFTPEVDGDPARERLDGSHVVVAGGQAVAIAEEAHAPTGERCGATYPRLASTPTQSAADRPGDDGDHRRHSDQQPDPEWDVEVQAADPQPSDQIADPSHDEVEDPLRQRRTGAQAREAGLRQA